MKAISCPAGRLVIGVVIVAIYAIPFLTQPGLSGVYLKIEGVPGESTDEAHKDWIELDSVQFGVERPGDPLSGGQTADPPEFKEVLLAKAVDKASPKLMLACATGKVYPKVEIEYTRSTQAGEITFMRLTLTDVLVTSLSHRAESDEQRVVTSSEQSGMNFVKLKWEYIPVDADTGKVGETIVEEFDRAQLEPGGPQ